MESKLTALFALSIFIGLSVAGVVLRFLLGVNFSLENYLLRLIILTFMVILLGRPFVKIALDLIRNSYHEHEDHFHVPGTRLKKPTREPAAQEGESGKA